MLKWLSLLFASIFLLAACSSVATPIPTQAPTQEATAQSLDWINISLTDSHTEKSFTLKSFAGKTVYVEPMATWCTNCRAQLPNVEAARVQLNSDEYVFVGLSVAENVDDKTLADYVDKYGWHFIFAVAPDSLTKALVDVFGRTIVTPPSTPHFIIRPDGSITGMTTGFHSADQLVTEIKGERQG